MAKFYCTFGFGHPHANHFHVVFAENSKEVHEKMYERFGNKWSMVYTEKEWYIDGISQEELYNLKEIK